MTDAEHDPVSKMLLVRKTQHLLLCMRLVYSVGYCQWYNITSIISVGITTYFSMLHIEMDS